VALGKITEGEAHETVKSWLDSKDDVDGYANACSELMTAYGDDAEARDQAIEAIRTLKPTSMKISAAVKYVHAINKHRMDLINAGETMKEASKIAMRAVYKRIGREHVNTYLMAIGKFAPNNDQELYEHDPCGHFVAFLKWLLQSKHKHRESEDEDDSGFVTDTTNSYSTIASTSSQQPVRSKPPLFNKPRSSYQKPKFNSPTKFNISPRKRTFLCVYCKKNHKDDKCDLDVNARHVFAEKNGLCKSCMKSDHKTEKCTSKLTCNHCGMQGLWRRHHTSLCRSPYAMEARRLGKIVDWKAYHEKREQSETYPKPDSSPTKPQPFKITKSVRATMTQIVEDVLANASADSQVQEESDDDDLTNDEPDADLLPLPESEKTEDTTEKSADD
jgi:hypothetical protein